MKQRLFLVELLLISACYNGYTKTFSLQTHTIQRPLPPILNTAVDRNYFCFRLIRQSRNFLSIYINKGADKTARAYRAALRKFQEVLELNHISTTTAVNQINFDLVSDFVALLQDEDGKTTVAAERLYLTAFRQFISFLSAEENADIPVVRILENNQEASPHRRATDTRCVDIEGVKRFLWFMEDYKIPAGTSQDEILRIRRDRALIFILAEAGLRIDEACKLKRENINWTANQARFIGKKDKEAVVRLSTKSIQYLRDYLATRQDLDGASGKALQALPLFARHDLGAGKRMSAITTTTGREIIEKWVKASKLEDLTSPITPHSLRHNFVTMVYEATGDLKLAQELARHESTNTPPNATLISLTQSWMKHTVLPLRIDEFFGDNILQKTRDELHPEGHKRLHTRLKHVPVHLMLPPKYAEAWKKPKNGAESHLSGTP